jgi:acyl dehydratase
VTAPTAAASAPKPGDPVPPFERQITTDAIMAYGAATWDWHRLHYDQQYARSLGLPDIVLDGQAMGALFARALMAWLGPRAFIRKLSFQLRSMVVPGDTLRCEGEVSAVASDDQAVIVTVSQRLQVGDRLAAEAVTEVRLPK